MFSCGVACSVADVVTECKGRGYRRIDRSAGDDDIAADITIHIINRRESRLDVSVAGIQIDRASRQCNDGRVIVGDIDRARNLRGRRAVGVRDVVGHNVGVRNSGVDGISSNNDVGR